MVAMFIVGHEFMCDYTKICRNTDEERNVFFPSSKPHNVQCTFMFETVSTASLRCECKSESDSVTMEGTRNKERCVAFTI